MLYCHIPTYLTPTHPAWMISRPSIEPNLLPPAGQDGASLSVRAAADASKAAYGWDFWFAYLANSAMMIAISLLFRYADFVTFLGGTELQLGWIVGVGMVGSLLMRVAQGVGIDRYGARRIWLVSAAGFVLSCFGHLWVASADGPMIYALRIAFNTSIAGVFGASITYISRSAPAPRMAEVVGTLGTSGFVGMVTGTYLGDWLFGSGPVEAWHLTRMFEIASALGTAAFIFAWLATRNASPPRRRKQPSMWWLLRRYHPGMVLLVGVAMGVGLGLPQTFLRPFAAELGIAQIAIFFSVYAPTAFITRLSIRRLPEKIGIRPMILLGLGALSIGMLLCLTVSASWQLTVPAIFFGIAHAMLFPSVVAGGSAAFPVRYRGLGTTLVLAMFDLGNLIGAPTAGFILHHAQWTGLPRYSVMFFCIAMLMAAIGAAYGYSSRHQGNNPKPSIRIRPRRPKRKPQTTGSSNGHTQAESYATPTR